MADVVVGAGFTREFAQWLDDEESSYEEREHENIIKTYVLRSCRRRPCEEERNQKD